MAAFKEWAKAEGLETNSPLADFEGRRIAIDAEDYLNGILTSTATREPLLPALGGLPFALQKNVDSDLKSFEEAGVRPIFVFNGLGADIACKDRATISRECRKAVKILDDAWSAYDHGQGDDAVTAFGKVCNYRTDHVVRWLQVHLHKAGVSVQTAPYLAAAQLVHLEAHGYADAVAGSASCLVFGADKVITSFDWEAQRLAWVDVKQCQGKLLLNGDQFNDLMLLSGCSFLPAISMIEEDLPAARVAATRSLLSRNNQDGHLVCLQSKDEDYLNAFRKARFVIKHSPLLTEDGSIKPKAENALPNDSHEFVSQRLPDELYFYLSRGVASPRVLNWRVRMVVFETPPLDGGSSLAYKELVQDKLRPLRAQALALITRLAHRYYQKTDVDLICWFNENDKRQLSIPANPFFEDNSESPEVNKWHVKVTEIQAGGGHAFADMPLTAAIDLLSNESTAKKTITPRKDGEDSVLKEPDELLANTIFRFMQDRGYINNDHTLSAWGKALKAALESAKGNGHNGGGTSKTEVEEPLFMAFELLRLDLLNSKLMFQTPPYSGQPLRGSETDKAHTLLISRIACLGTLTHDQIGYTGPLSRHLLAYHQMTAAVRGALRDLSEMHACNLFLSGAVDRQLPSKQYTDLGANLPFVKEPDLGLSLVVKSYLDELSNDATKRTDIAKWFNHAADIHGDLRKAWSLWAAVYAGIQAADSSIVSNETRKLFKNADEWLQNKLASAPTVNGSS